MTPPYPQQRSCLLTWTFILHEQNSSRKKRHRRIMWFFYEQECCVLITLWLSMALNAFFCAGKHTRWTLAEKKKKSLFFLKVKAIWRVKKCNWHSLVVGREAEHGKGSVESCFICEQRFCANCTNLCSFRNTCVLWHYHLQCSVGKYAKKIDQTCCTFWCSSILSVLGLHILTLGMSSPNLDKPEQWQTHTNDLGSCKFNSESEETSPMHHLPVFLK